MFVWVASCGGTHGCRIPDVLNLVTEHPCVFRSIFKKTSVRIMSCSRHRKRRINTTVQEQLSKMR